MPANVGGITIPIGVDAKDIPMNISLKEFYEYSKIELHMFSFEINTFLIRQIYTECVEPVYT